MARSESREHPLRGRLLACGIAARSARLARVVARRLGAVEHEGAVGHPHVQLRRLAAQRDVLEQTAGCTARAYYPERLVEIGPNGEARDLYQELHGRITVLAVDYLDRPIGFLNREVSEDRPLLWRWSVDGRQPP